MKAFCRKARARVADRVGRAPFKGFACDHKTNLPKPAYSKTRTMKINTPVLFATITCALAITAGAQTASKPQDVRVVNKPSEPAFIEGSVAISKGANVVVSGKVEVTNQRDVAPLPPIFAKGKKVKLGDDPEAAIVEDIAGQWVKLQLLRNGGNPGPIYWFYAPNLNSAAITQWRWTEVQ